MNEALRTVMTRILSPGELLKLKSAGDIENDDIEPRSTPIPEPEILGNPAYHRAVSGRNHVALEALREQLLALEVDVLLTIAASYEIVAKATSTRGFTSA